MNAVGSGDDAAGDAGNRTMQRVRRIVDLVVYLSARPGVAVADVCEHFGVTRRVLMQDLELLFLCGVPPYTPSDLFEVDIDDGHVWLRGTEMLTRSFGMSRNEAVRLLAAGRMVLASTDAGDRAVVESAVDKLRDALDAPPIEVGAAPTDMDIRVTVARAVGERRCLELAYLSYGRDTETVRVVEPVRWFDLDGHRYLRAWCRSAGDWRTFRCDRIRAVRELDESVTAREDDASVGFSDITRGMELRAVLTLDPGGDWVPRHWPCERVERTDDGGLRVEIAADDPTYLLRVVLRAAAHVRTVEPPWLREALGERVSELSSWYPPDDAQR